MSFPFRSSSGLSVTKTTPVLEALTKPLMESPGKATELATPGCSSAIDDISRMTASVRSSVAASGSCAKATRYDLSCGGTKPRGTFVRPSQVRPTRPA
jgi:hypothetical protein